MNLLIAGCGYVGASLGQEAAKNGWGVWGLSRHPKSIEGIKPLSADLLNPQDLDSLPQVDYAVLSQSPSQDSDNYEKTYLIATQNLVTALTGQKLKKLIFISSTGVYGEQNGAWVDEKTDPCPKDENSRILLKTENIVLNCGFPVIILRLSGIYGPGRNRVKSIKEGRVKPVFSETYMNRVHLVDVVSAIRLLLDRGLPGEIYLASDDEPSTEGEFYACLHQNALINEVPKGSDPSGTERRGKRCSNHKLKSLGWVLRYPTYREGYRALASL